MSEEEQHELFKKAFANTLRKLAEEPEELFDNDKLQKKYNNLLKEHIKLKKELQQSKEIALNEHKYASEMEDKYITANNIINELEKELDRGYLDLFAHELVPGRELITNIKNYLQELKGSVNNENL